MMTAGKTHGLFYLVYQDLSNVCMNADGLHFEQAETERVKAE